MKDERDNQLTPFQVRPRFEKQLHCTPQEVAKKLNDALKQSDASCIGWSNDQYGVLSITKEAQHYWSPQLALSMEAVAQITHLHGRYEPKPIVWTMFVFFYSFVGFVLFFVAIIGTSRWSLGESAAILWWIPVLLLVGLTLFLISYFGQKIGHDQIIILHQFLEDTLQGDEVNQQLS